MKYQIIANTIVVGTTNSGDKFLVDAEDLQLVSQYTWTNNNGYLVAWDKEQSKNIYLHRLIMGVHKEAADHKSNIVHHISHIVSDNRKKNLQLVSRQENLRMCKLSKRNTSGITGVSWNCGKKRWQATIRVNFKLIMLGMKEKLEDAIVVRKEAESFYFQ